MKKTRFGKKAVLIGDQFNAAVAFNCLDSVRKFVFKSQGGKKLPYVNQTKFAYNLKFAEMPFIIKSFYGVKK